MSFQQYIEEKMSHIHAEINAGIDEYKNTNFLSEGPYGEYLDTYKDFVLRGKCIRGGLFLLVVESYGRKIAHDEYALSAAIECLHASTLIHDDIIDNDELRRGKLSIFGYYSRIIRNHTVEDPIIIGKSMALLLGDIGYFIAMCVLFRLKRSDGYLRFGLQKICEYFIEVGFGQIDDLRYSNGIIDPNEHMIRDMYIKKTAHYTFSLPLCLGSIICGQSDDMYRSMHILGESIGLIFQLRDDELNILGSAEKTGKSCGTDIRDNKKTLIRYFLLQYLTSADKTRLTRLFGNQSLSLSEMTWIRDIYRSSGVQKSIVSIMQHEVDKAVGIIKKLPFSLHHIEILNDLVRYVKERDR